MEVFLLNESTLVKNTCYMAVTGNISEEDGHYFVSNAKLRHVGLYIETKHSPGFGDAECNHIIFENGIVYDYNNKGGYFIKCSMLK